jgi:hypothetical protein
MLFPPPRGSIIAITSCTDPTSATPYVAFQVRFPLPPIRQQVPGGFRYEGPWYSDRPQAFLTEERYRASISPYGGSAASSFPSNPEIGTRLEVGFGKLHDVHAILLGLFLKLTQRNTTANPPPWLVQPMATQPRPRRAPSFGLSSRADGRLEQSLSRPG